MASFGKIGPLRIHLDFEPRDYKYLHNLPL
jgi:hypothetical protein